MTETSWRLRETSFLALSLSRLRSFGQAYVTTLKMAAGLGYIKGPLENLILSGFWSGSLEFASQVWLKSEYKCKNR